MLLNPNTINQYPRLLSQLLPDMELSHIAFFDEILEFVS